MEPDKNLPAWSDKVVWQEGMTLDPHHFQQWDRSHAAKLNARMRAVSPFYWGLTHIEINMDGLANGEFSLIDCKGVMRDGLPFEISISLGNLPDSRNISEYPKFTASKKTLGVYLAIPALRPDGANVKLQDSTRQSPTRYLAHTITPSDENTGEGERPVEVAGLNFSLFFEGEDEKMRGYSVMQIAQLERVRDGEYGLTKRFAPTSLFIGASYYLRRLTSRILENLVTHSTKVTRRATGIFSQNETTPQDVLVFGRLGVVNANIPVIKHYDEEQTSHPEALYLALVSLAGQLFTYIRNVKITPNDYPTYNHNNLTQSFTKLEEILAELIHEEAPSPLHSDIELRQIRPNIYQAVVDPSLLEKGRLFVVARSRNIPEHKLNAELPNAVRVASPGLIDTVLGAAVPALEILHTSRPPVSVPIDDGASYFELQKQGHYWGAISDESAIAIFLPYDRSQVEIYLLVVKPS